MGKVFSIEEFSTFDGPGVRATVFLKGCPLRCTWCHNPEGQSFSSQFVRSPNGCIRCGKCECVADKQDGKIVLTQRSMDECPRNLIRVSGIDYTAQELADKLNKLADILSSSDGGITFSGGEPLCQLDFIEEVVPLLDKRLSVALQTSGYAQSTVFEKALNICDYFLFDLKIMDASQHKEFCGVDNASIKENYRALVKSGKNFITRVPLIPTVTDTKENLTAIARFMQENGVDRVELLPYNKFAGSKYAMVLRDYEPNFDEKKELYFGRDIFDKYSIKSSVL